MTMLLCRLSPVLWIGAGMFMLCLAGLVFPCAWLLGALGLHRLFIAPRLRETLGPQEFAESELCMTGGLMVALGFYTLLCKTILATNVVTAVVLTAAFLSSHAGTRPRKPGVLALGLVAACGLSLVWRHLHPLSWEASPGQGLLERCLFMAEQSLIGLQTRLPAAWAFCVSVLALFLVAFRNRGPEALAPRRPSRPPT